MQYCTCSSPPKIPLFRVLCALECSSKVFANDHRPRRKRCENECSHSHTHTRKLSKSGVAAVRPLGSVAHKLRQPTKTSNNKFWYIVLVWLFICLCVSMYEYLVKLVHRCGVIAVGHSPSCGLLFACLRLGLRAQYANFNCNSSPLGFNTINNLPPPTFGWKPKFLTDFKFVAAVILVVIAHPLTAVALASMLVANYAN